MADSKPHAGRFSSDRQPAKRRGPGKASKTQLLKAFKESNIDPTEYWKKLIAEAMADPSSTASSLVAQRLMPALKPQTQELEPGLIDESWLELSHTSRLTYIIYLTLNGNLSPDHAVMLSKMLADGAQLELDIGELISDAAIAEQTGDKSKMELYNDMYKLEAKIRQQALNDTEKLKTMLQTEGAEAGTSNNNNDTDDTETGGLFDDNEQQ